MNNLVVFGIGVAVGYVLHITAVWDAVTAAAVGIVVWIRDKIWPNA